MRQSLLSTFFVGKHIKNKCPTNHNDHITCNSNGTGGGLAGTGINDQLAQSTQSNDQA